MTISISNILNDTISQMGAQVAKKEQNQNGEFVFEFQGREYSYESKAAFMEDVADGNIDNGKATFEGKLEQFAKSLPIVGQLFASYDEGHDVEDSQKKEIVGAEKESDAATELTDNAQKNIDGIDKSANKADEDSSKDKELINEKNEEIAKLREELKQYEKEQKAAQEEELAKAIKKAEKEYDPEKHGDNKEAYINKQVAGIIDPAKTQSTELKDELKSLETEVKGLFEKIANRNKINRQNSFTKLSINTQNTFTTATTASAEEHKKQMEGLYVAA